VGRLGRDSDRSKDHTLQERPGKAENEVKGPCETGLLEVNQLVHLYQSLITSVTSMNFGILILFLRGQVC